MGSLGTRSLIVATNLLMVVWPFWSHYPLAFRDFISLEPLSWNIITSSKGTFSRFSTSHYPGLVINVFGPTLVTTLPPFDMCDPWPRWTWNTWMSFKLLRAHDQGMETVKGLGSNFIGFWNKKISKLGNWSML
jgi:hypothetical protein